MLANKAKWIIFRRRQYVDKLPLILVNGLASQAETWYCNEKDWQRYFTLKTPEFIVYDGEIIQNRIRERKKVDMNFLVSQLEKYLDNFVQKPPYSLIGSSLGGQIITEYAVKNPAKTNKLVLICPSGMSKERLPLIEGVSRYDPYAVISSIFYKPIVTDSSLIQKYEKNFADKNWRRGAVRTVKGTMENRIKDKLPQIKNSVLVICGKEDQVVDSKEIEQAVSQLENFKFVLLDNCGHAPQIEKPQLVNNLVKAFLFENSGSNSY